MHYQRPRYWQAAPMLRILPSFAGGMIAAWYGGLSPGVLLPALLACALGLLLLAGLPLRLRFRLVVVQGLLLHGLLAAAGGLLLWRGDVRHRPQWPGYHSGDSLLVVQLLEPPVPRPKSWKAAARLEGVVRAGQLHPASGGVLLYFAREGLPALDYGHRLLLRRPLQPVRGSGNPGGFDFARYALFNGQTYQAFLRPSDYRLLQGSPPDDLQSALFRLRRQIVALLQTHIPDPVTAGLAEALLIGYKNDLDKQLTQAYADTGVVHVIAISGLHLGLIYGLLLALTRPMRGRQLRAARLVVVLAGLWGFSLLAGAGPSVLRSALMFSVLATGEVLDRRARSLNSLAFSAFLLLCWQPFWLWDAGFQLSYAAVLGILLLYRPVLQLCQFHHPLTRFLWQLMAVTLAAQVFTLPVGLYHFHRFPLLFPITNLVAVPLSSAALLAELLLCALCFYPPAAALAGWLTAFLIGLMNGFVLATGRLPFAVWPGLSISLLQAVLLTALLAALARAMLARSRAACWWAAVFVLGFSGLRLQSFLQAAGQQRLIVYQVPGQSAVEAVSGRRSWVFMDSALQHNPDAQRFHLEGARVEGRFKPMGVLPSTFRFGGKTICLLADAFPGLPAGLDTVDLLVLTGRPRLYLGRLAAQVHIRQVVLDASVPQSRRRWWVRHCDSLRIPLYDVGEKGAFVMPLRSPTFAAP